MEKREFVAQRSVQREWGWWIILALFLTGSGAGAFFFALILGSLSRMLAGVTLVFVGLLFMLADLNRPWQAWRVVMRPQTSWISRGALLVAIFFVLSLLHMMALSVRSDTWTLSGFPWITGPAGAVILGVLAGASALAVMAYPGYSLGKMRPVPLWHTGFMPAVFLVSGLLCGLGVTYLAPPQQGPGAWGLDILDGLGVGLPLLGAFFFVGLIRPGAPARESGEILSRRPYRLGLAGGVVGVGLLVPCVILTLVLGGAAGAPLLTVAGMLLLLGMLLLRYMIVKAGTYISPV